MQDPNAIAKGSTHSVGTWSAVGYAYLLALLTLPKLPGRSWGGTWVANPGPKGKTYANSDWHLANARSCFETVDLGTIQR
jgi:hypothetical protein